MKILLEVISRIWFFIWGNFFTLFFYDRKYYKGEWFKGKYSRVFAPGWRWVYYDGKDRLFRGTHKGIPWPVSSNITITAWENIEFDPEDLRLFQGKGNYYQAMNGKLKIGSGVWIAPNVGIIVSNHDVNNLEMRGKAGDIYIGDKSWLGMNSVILPGVKLGEKTIVGAGSVVTKSFEGNCVIAGNPAKLIKKLD